MDQYQNNYVQNTYKGRGAEGGGLNSYLEVWNSSK